MKKANSRVVAGKLHQTDQAAREMTRADVEAWRAGWRAVKQLELQDAKLKSVRERWREINMLFDFGYELGLVRAASEAELAPIRARWTRLKANYP